MKPAAASTMERMRNERRDVLTLSFKVFHSPAPNAWLVSTVAPAPPPTATAMKTEVKAYEAPTDARAFSPMNLPTMTESAIV